MENIPFREKISVHPPKIIPKINNIGHGNPRYNSLVAYKNSAALPVGSTLRIIDLQKDEISYNKQIGCSQIFIIMENQKYFLTINFQGLITLINKQTLETSHQFLAGGKQIRHAAFTDKYLVVCCELMENIFKKIQVFSLQNIQQKKYQPIYSEEQSFYYPELCGNKLIVLQYDNPNPRNKSRTQTVLKEKLPIKNRIVCYNQLFQKESKQVFQIKIEGDMICSMKIDHKNHIYYLHSNKKISFFNIETKQLLYVDILAKSGVLCIQKYKDGIIYASAPNIMSYLRYENDKFVTENIEINSKGVGTNYCIRAFEKGFYFFNQQGLHFYDNQSKKTFTSSIYNITNCGISFNKDGSRFALGDFESVYIMQTQTKSMVPKPLSYSFIGIPVRTLVWCQKVQKVIIGCIGGSLYEWDTVSQVCTFVKDYQHSINILRYANGYIFAGTAMGQIIILEQQTLKQQFSFKAHHPIQYQTQQQKQLFGTMKNFAEIWSLAISPVHQHHVIVSSSEDQTEKVHQIKGQQVQLIHHLKGHQLAVTSVDWKVMGKQLGQIYVSCSDDKIVRFRKPDEDFSILFELQTSTVREWHTLTYLALEPAGYRVAVGTQNGYLFIYDIAKRELLFGEKIHLGGVQGLEWHGNKICTISSDLCVCVIDLKGL